MKAKLFTFVRGLKNGTPPRFQSYLKSLTLLLAMLLSVNVWGGTAELTSVSTKNVVETKGESVSLKFGDVTCNVTRNSGNQPGFYTSSGIVRYYSNDVMTLSVPSGSTISKIEFDMTSGTVGTASPTGLSTDSKTWTGSANSVSFTGGGTVKITSITVTYSAASANPYTVTFNAGSGTCNTQSSTETSGGSGVTLPSASPSSACSTEGWTFAGWKETSAQTETTSAPTLLAAGSNYKPSANCTLYAVYKKIEEGGTVFSKYQQVTLGGTITDGQYLISTGSYTMAGSGKTGASFTPGTTEATAKEYTITTLGSGVFTIKGPDNNYVGGADGTGLTFSTTTPSENAYKWKYNSTGIQNQAYNTRYIRAYGTTDFRHYTTSNGTTTYLYKRVETSGSTTTYNSNPTCGPSSYTVNFAVDPAGYGTVSQSSLANVASGTSISSDGATLTVGSTNITATPTTATAQYTYTFNNWTWSPTGSTITAATTATANFNRTENSYTVSYEDGGKVDYTNKPTSVKYSDEGLTINATPKFGYNITGVAVTMGGSPLTLDEDYTWEDGELMIMPTNFTGNINITFTTELVQSCTNEITITQGTPSNGSFDLSQIGTVCIDGGNATVSITNITPAEHYHFKQITATNGDVDNTNEQVTNISDNTTINVEFEENTKYTITFVDAVHGESVASKSVYENETFTFPTIGDKAATTSGTCEQIHYHFMGWVLSTHEGTIDAEDIKTGTSAAVTAAATYYAVWAKEEL